MVQATLFDYEAVHKTRLEQLQDRCTQRDIILALLKRRSFVPTAVLRMRAYQYGARIFELRRGQHDGIIYQIRACRIDGVCGFSMEREGVGADGRETEY